MQQLELWQYITIALGAAFVGLGKGGLPGIGNLTVVLLALALPAKASVGVLLPILISADIVAVAVYRATRAMALHPTLGALDGRGHCYRVFSFQPSERRTC